METPRLCPECRAPLPADAPAGLCPRCLLQQGALRDSASAPTEPPRRHKGPPSAPALAVVAARFPQFEVRKLIGVGGMGAVYEVRQPQLDRIVALKVMLPEVSDDPRFAERFSREARALAKLNHPNIVAVYDFGQAGDWFYFVMEFVDGANLRQTMRAGRLTAAQALAIVPKLCDALQFAHDEGIMHRDIKPENILIDKKGRVKIADFGLAKLLGAEPDDHSITVTGVGMGTPRYMAPEQLDDAKNVDHRADIYSLGVVFYEMLTGELPMGRFATPSEKVQIDVRLDEIVLRSLERDVARRYQHVSEVKTAVENVTSTPGATATPTPPAATPVSQPPGSGKSREPHFQSAETNEPRLSRLALAGAIWTVLGVVSTVFWALWNHFYGAPPTPATDVLTAQAREITYYLPKWPFFILALTAPFGATILGGVALAQIKRSRGRLYGLRLAAADLLVFPLVLLGCLVVLGAKQILSALETPGHSGFSALIPVLVAVVGCFIAGWVAWRKISPFTVTKDSATAAPPLDHRAAVGPVAPRRRHALYAVLTLLFLGGFFFGAAFHAKRGGGTTLLMIGALDPLFIRESGPSGFSTSLNFFSWSFLAWVVGGGAFSALLRVLREDEGKVPRDRAWWRDWWKQVGIWGGLLLAVCVVRTVMNPRAVLQPPANRQVAAAYTKPLNAAKAAPSRDFSITQDHSQLPVARTPGRQDYAFTFAAPTNHTLNVWLEVWRDGKLEIVDSFDFWARPKHGAPLAAALRLTTMDGDVASVESAGKVRFDWTMNCGGTNGTGMTAGAWRTNIFKNCFSLTSTWDYPPKDGWHPRVGETVTVLALCGYRPDNLSTYDQTWDETSLLKGWPNEAILLRARYNPARVGDLADGPSLGNNVTDRGNIRHTFAQFTIAKVIGVDLGRPANPADAHRLLVAAVATPERQQAVKKMTFQLGAGGAWQNTASPEELITKLEQAIDDVTSKKRIVQAEPGGPLMIGANGPELHADAIKKLKLSKLQADEINRILQSHHRDYLALERRHSKITKDAQGRIVTTIAPFTDECQALAKRLVAELGGIVEFAILPQPRVGQLPTQIFRWGGELPQTITMWKADGKYFVEDKSGAFTFNMSGPNLSDLPAQYRLFWREE